MKQEFNISAGGTAKRHGDERIIHGEAIADPYQGLENPDSPSVRRWLMQQEARYSEYIGDNQDAGHISRPVHKGIPAKAGEGYLFYYQSDGDEIAGINISDSADGPGRPFIGPEELSQNKNQQILKASISPDGENLAFIISEKGRPDGTLRVRNIKTGEDLDDVVERAGHVWWDKDGQGMVYNQLSDDGLGRVILKHHKLGDLQDKDSVYYDPPEVAGSTASLMHGGHLTHSSYNGQHEWLFKGGYDAKLGLSVKNNDADDYKDIFAAGVAEYEPVGDSERGVLMRTTKDAPNGKVVLFDPESPGETNWTSIIPEDPHDRLKHVFMHKDHLVALYNDNCADRVDVFDLDGNKKFTAPLPEQSKVTFSHATIAGTSLGAGAQTNTEEDLFMQVETFSQPASVYGFDVMTNTLTPLEAETATGQFENDLVVEQLWATSKDGTQIPMSVMRHPDTKLDGTAALRITGYGGFGASPGPHFDEHMQDFVHNGGIFVQANIRGGGEFGEPWHQQGSGLNQQNTFDDFAACAQHLVDKRYTSNSRMVAEGQSQGGLTVLATMQQNPDLFGAVIASVPVADLLDKKMKGFASEYGDPYENRDDFENLKGLSPLHNVRPGQSYPPCLIRTAGQDKLLMGGALKLAATMQHECPQNTTLLHVEHDYGHMVSRPKHVADNEYIAQKNFIERSVGPINQDRFRQSRGSALSVRRAAMAQPKSR